jgi:hypothetical protein
MRYTPAIFDRTVEDITNKTFKAYLNVEDWRRIYNNSRVANALVAFLVNIDIAFDEISMPTTTTIPTVVELNTLLTNIGEIRIASGLPPITGLVEIKNDWLPGSSADSPTYVDVNDWERVIDIIFHSIGILVDYNRIYCGVPNVGQPSFWQHRFRQFNWVPVSESPVRRARTGIAATGAGLTWNNSFRRYA